MDKFSDPSLFDSLSFGDKMAGSAITMLMGMGVAIPHGTNEAKDAVRRTGVVLQQYPEGVDFDGEKAYLLFGIAGKGEEHLEVLAAICKVLEDEEVLERMKTTDDVAWIVEKLNASK